MRIDTTTIGEDEYATWHAPYVNRLRAHCSDVLAQLAAQRDHTAALLAGISTDKAGYRYAPGKWSIREVVGHLSDAERIMSYRALRFARADATPLAGFDENAFATAAKSDSRPLPELAAEYSAVRAATIALFAHLEPAALTRRGVASGTTFSVRGLAAVIGGHELHHLALLEERYLAP